MPLDLFGRLNIEQQPNSFTPNPWLDLGGGLLNIGSNQGVGGGIQGGGYVVTPEHEELVTATADTGSAPPPNTDTMPNVFGATTPDLLIVRGNQAYGGGSGGKLTIGGLALILLLAVGGWWLYKRFKQ